MDMKIAQLVQTKIRSGLCIEFLLDSAQVRSTGSSADCGVTKLLQKITFQN